MARHGKAIFLTATAAMLAAAAQCFASAPLWSQNGSLGGAAAAEVVLIDSSSPAKLIVLESPAGAMRIGALCDLYRGNQKVGGILVFETKGGRSVALGLGQTEAKPGDAAYPQITRQSI